MDETSKKWIHQEEAISIFLEKKHGILEMATGSGKTYTSIQIMKKLLEAKKIEKIIIIIYGNDLLYQWYYSLLKEMHNIKIFRHFDKYREINKFVLVKGQSILLLTRDADRIRECLIELEKRRDSDKTKKNTMLIFDEIHGLGSPKLRDTLKGYLQGYTYRLGLSATPERDYDEEGNIFIKDEIGEVIYKFDLEEAIKRGILCPFTYVPVFYNLTDEERVKKKKIIAAYEIKRKKGITFDESDMYRDLSRVNKTASEKIPLFEKVLVQKPELLQNSIIFVETREYGIALQKMLVRYISRFHTYYGEDGKENLKKFCDGNMDCLITCKKISEGIDIHAVKNIILFSSDKGKIVTIQRIGRSLRKNINEPSKEACIVDFIYGDPDCEDVTTDRERMEWLSKLARVRSK